MRLFIMAPALGFETGGRHGRRGRAVGHVCDPGVKGVKRWATPSSSTDSHEKRARDGGGVRRLACDRRQSFGDQKLGETTVRMSVQVPLY